MVVSYNNYSVSVFPTSEVIFVEVRFEIVFDGLVVLKDGKFIKRRRTVKPAKLDDDFDLLDCVDIEDVEVTMPKLLGGKDMTGTLLSRTDIHFVFGYLTNNTVVPGLLEFFEAELIGSVLGS